MSTAIYARISFDRQDGAGVGRQLEDCRALVEREGWGPAVEYVDNNSSAFSGKVRPRYRELLAAVKAGEHGRIVVWKLDRLYRSSRELEVDLLPLAETGQVTIHAVMAGLFDLATSHGRTMCRVATAFSTQSSEDTRERIKRAKQEAREQGKGNGGPRPFGWKDMSKPHPDEAERVRMAVEDAISGVSLADIARRWNAAGVGQPQTGRANWTADIVHQVLSNPRHAGLIGHRIEKPRRENGGREYERAVVVGEAKWPAIVERSRWEQLQAVLLHRGAGGRVPRRRSLLTGLVSCSACGTTMVRTGARGKDPSGAIRKVWRCPNGRGCGNVSIDAAGLEGLLVEATVIRADTE
ncbi:MAG TPA: recombinase family protein, partial [Candidatus Dormibacteraeota bacterium]